MGRISSLTSAQLERKLLRKSWASLAQLLSVSFLVIIPDNLSGIIGATMTHGFTSDHHGPKFQIIMEIVPIMSTINFCSCWTEVVDENCSHHGNNFDGLWSQELVTIMVTSWQTVRFVTIYMALAKMCPNLGRIFKTIIFLLPDKLSGICCLKNYSQVGNNFLAHFRSIWAEVNVKSLANLARLFWLTLSQLATKSISLSRILPNLGWFFSVQ